MKNNKVFIQVTNIILPILSILTLCLVWSLLAMGEGSLLPTLPEVWNRAVELVTRPVAKATLLGHVLVSLRRVVIAMCFSTTIGITLGVFFGWNKTFRDVIGPIFDLLRPIPPIAWLPLIIIWCGIGEMSKIVIVFIGSVVGIVLNTQTGMDSIDPKLINCGRCLGCNRMQLLVHVAIPSAVPAILAGVRGSLSSGWMCVLAAEMIAARQGVGFLIIQGQENFDMAQIVVGMFAIGIVNTLISQGLSKLEGVICPWQYSKSK